ncbi:hypothetical protein SAMN06265784_101356 [Paraburkholderia susongensis]|uniref:Uncharacterized protein n=1 Tax=Paraburkholderia susongensis TaxID=1515439 RepID=A0A1X7I733_9BURK|nr:hypothetical protein SAMN06265784_101356 [Paraburkholderia susongensis]
MNGYDAMRAGFEEQRARAINVDWFTWQIAWLDAQAVTLEEAAAAVADHCRKGREWIPGSLWDTLTRECAARVRAIGRR